MAVKVHLRHLRISPRKVRLVINLVRGMDAGLAESQLDFLPKRAALPVLKLLRSALAAADNDFKLEKKDLYISEIRVDEGPILKRYTSKAMGRSAPIHKKTSHITLILDKKPAVDTKDEMKEIKGKGVEKSENSDKKPEKTKDKTVKAEKQEVKKKNNTNKK